MASSQATDRTRDAPTSEKARTIVEAARDLGPDASNPAVADEVEDRLGDRPDESWVSRVRSKYADAPVAEDVPDDDPDVVPPDELTLRVDALAGRLDRFASNVQAVDHALSELEARVDSIEDDVDDTDDLADTFEELSERLRGE